MQIQGQLDLLTFTSVGTTFDIISCLEGIKL